MEKNGMANQLTDIEVINYNYCTDLLLTTKLMYKPGH